MPITQSWREYYETVNESFIQRLDHIIDKMNQNVSTVERIDWEVCGVDEESENQRRERIRSKFIKCGFSVSTIMRWIPDVKIDDEGTWIEVSHGKYGIIDPAIASGEEETRDNIFQFLGILKLTISQTEELLKKVFFCRSFNLKNHFELVCYFYACRAPFETGWYIKAKEFLERNGLESIPYQEPEEVAFTQEILTDMDAISTEDDLAEYIQTHFSLFAKGNQYITAKEQVDDQLKKCWKAAVFEIEEFGYNNLEGTGINIYKDYDKNNPKVSVLLHIVLGHSVRRETPINQYDPILIPAPVSKNFPTPTILNNIISGKEKSMDKIRKMLILLAFYRWSAETQQFNKKIFNGHQDWNITEHISENSYSNALYIAQHKALLKTCIVTINSVLENANFPELSENDLYDALFLFAAGTDNPLQRFREIMLQAKPDKGSA